MTNFATDFSEKGLGLTDITPEHRFKDDIRPVEIFLAMGGFWLLLGVIGWVALAN